MSMDSSLRSGSGMGRHRNVLTRGERIIKLKGDGKWNEGDAVLHLPKVGNRKVSLGKVKDEPAAEGTAGAAAAAPAAGAKAAAPAAAAKPAAGAKAAPAKK